MALMLPRYPFRSLLPVLLAGLGVLAPGCSSQGPEPRPDTTGVRPRPAARARPTAARPLIDLPAVLHLRPAAFAARFGQSRPLAGFVDPGKALESTAFPADSAALFQLPGLTMVVSFRPGAGAVQDVLLLGADEATLLRQATLQPADPAYLLLPVFEPRRPNRLLGLRVVPK